VLWSVFAILLRYKPSPEHRCWSSEPDLASFQRYQPGADLGVELHDGRLGAKMMKDQLKGASPTKRS
jgi:hypothetical protein